VDLIYLDPPFNSKSDDDDGVGALAIIFVERRLDGQVIRLPL